MDDRKQFTFYVSYWEAIEQLPAKSQLPILKAIIKYALFGEEPTSLSGACRSIFLLVKPTLDASRKKAANGKQGGSKPKANRKQSAREKENEEEIEKENEIKGEIDKKHPAPNDGKLFTAFWESYPDKCDREGAWEAWCGLNPDARLAGTIMASLDAWKRSAQWQDQNGKFIPRAAKWLAQGHWQNSPAPAKQAGNQTGSVWGCGKLGEAELANIHRTMAEKFDEENET